MPVVFTRVDNRLVHGQVLEAWVPRLQAEAILVVDAALACDPLQRMILETLGRPGLEVLLATPEQASVLLAGRLLQRRVVLLFAGPRQALDAFTAGVRFGHLNLGNVHPRQGSRRLTASVYLTAADAAQLLELVDCGVALEAKAVPSDASPDVVAFLRTEGAGG